jgi:two-component system alkaline phosphatase synthesis response regulator PhoP
MIRGRILVIDDETDILELLRLCLTREGYEVLAAATGEQGLELAKSRQPALIVLDLMLPGADGLDVCKLLKSHPKTAETPIIILSAKGQESDIVAGLEVGADDYVTKPFSPRVLAARIRRLLNRGVEQRLDRSPVKVGGMTIDPARCEVLVGSDKLSLTVSEFNILYTLARRPGVVFTRYQIVDAVHGGDYIVSDRAVDVQVSYLRAKLGTYKDRIETVRGVGYRFTG